jgi:eukaryotic-like serine/threonine-protein kinase
VAEATDDVGALVAAGDYAGAARRAEAAGDLRRAIQLLERVWRFADALPLAERLGDRALAIRLALDARAEDRALAIAAAIPAGARADLESASASFAARGRWIEAAELAERAGATERAAAFYQRGGALLPAARALEAAGRWHDAGRLYEEMAEAATRDGEPELAARARLALGVLLGRLGRPRDAARALQAATRHASTELPAQRQLCVELEVLGLPHAAQLIARRLQRKDPALPDSAGAITEIELQAAAGRQLPAEPLRRFADLKLIGSGALGRVYVAQDRLLGETVALKILSVGPGGSSAERQSFQRFLREADASSRLRHPHIVRLLDVDERAGILVLEYLPGGTLAQALARGHHLDPAAGRRLALEVLSALAAAHGAGIVHRDVKPTNIFFDAAGNAKLADFGAAHLADFGGTQTAGFIGTLAYLSPEQVTGGRIGPAADLYALAVTLFETLTGRLPFLGPDLVGQHLAETPPTPTAVEPALSPLHDQVLLRALAKNATERFPSAEQMAEAVRGWPQSSRPSARPTTAAPAPEISEPARSAAPAERLAAGTTARGRLYTSTDPKIGRPILVEELSEPLTPEGLEAIKRLARAGGPHVQRVLALEEGGGAVVYERIEGEPVAAGALDPEEARQLEEAWAALASAGLYASPRHPVIRTVGGPVILVVLPQEPGYGDRP